MADKRATLIIQLKDNASKVMGKIRGAMDKLKQGYFKIAAGGVAAGLAIKNTITAFFEQEKAVNKLEAALRNVPGATAATSKNLQQLASDLQGVTTFGDEATIAMMSMLASMGMNEKQITELTPLIQDMAVAMNMDMVTAGQLVAKVMAGQTGALSRYGIQVEKTKDGVVTLGAMTRALSGFQGMATAQANTAAGRFKQLANTFGDFKEEIGAVLAKGLMPLVNGLRTLFQVFNSLSPATKQLIVGIAGIGLAVVALIPILGGLAIAISAVSAPVLIMVGALALLASGIMIIKTNFMGWGDAIKSVGDAIWTLVKGPITGLMAIFRGFKEGGFVGAFKALGKVGGDIAKKFEDVGKKTKTAVDKSGKAWDGLVKKVKDAKKQIGAATAVPAMGAMPGAPAGRKPTAIDSGKEKEEMDTFLDDLATMKEDELALMEEYDILDEERKMLRDELDMERKSAVDEFFAMKDEERLAFLQKNLSKQDALKAAAMLKDVSATDVSEKQKTLIHRVNEKERTAEAKRNAELRKQILGMEQGNYKDFSNFMIGATRSRYGAMRAIGKAFAIQQAIQNTYRAATGAYAALAPIPFVGPTLGKIASGIAIAWGLEQVARIAAAAEGGVVMPSPGGQIVRVAEGGKAEAIIPLDDEEAGERIAEGVGGGVQITINAGALMGSDDEAREFALKIDEELYKAKRAGETVSI